MLDVEVSAQAALELVEHRVRVGPGVDDDVGGDDVHPARDRPDVEIVDLADPGTGEHMPAQHLQVHAARGRLEQYVDRFAQEAHRARNDERDDEERRECVGELPPGEDGRQGGHDHSTGADDVRQDVEVCGADDERGVRIAEQEDRDGVGRESEDAHHEDETALYRRRLGETP